MKINPDLFEKCPLCQVLERKRGRKNMNNQLVKFLEGGVDHAGRAFDFILDQNDEWLEKTCDFIQWVFPTD